MKCPLLAAALMISATGYLGATPAEKSPVTFAEHIAPIVFQNCTTCHRPGEAGPFPMTNYAETRKRASLIAEVTSEKSMPPWHPDAGCGDFVGERRLTKEQIAEFQAWADAGAPEGDASKTPALPKFPEGWRGGTPDIVLTIDAPFEVPADGPDLYRQFVIPTKVDADSWVQGIEIRSAGTGALHHVLVWLDATGEARKLDEADPGPGFRKMGFKKTGALGGWAVGSGPRILPDGLAYPMKGGSDVILSCHFHPTGKIAAEKVTLGLYLAKQAPSRQIVALGLPPLFARGVGLDIPAGDANYTVKDSLTLPVDTDLITVGAHAHYTGKSMEAVATLPDGTKNTVFRISAWDFNWQDQYVYKKPVRLPAGTRLDVTIVWDNSASNPNNPFSPPRRITWGEETQDEMGSVHFVAVAANTSDHEKLAALSKTKSREVVSGLMKEGTEAVLVANKLKQALEMDVNHDGKLSADELPDFVKKSRVMNLIDKNGDGALDFEELKKARDAFKSLSQR
jgi:hypothetical protein